MYDIFFNDNAIKLLRYLMPLHYVIVNIIIIENYHNRAAVNLN